MARGIAALAAVAGVVVLATACTGTNTKPVPAPTPPDRTIAVAVTPSTSLEFDPVDVRLSGLKPGEHVTVTSTVKSYQNVPWTGVGKYTADASGVVDIAKQPSTGGTYTGIDASGLLWSMNPPAASGASVFIAPSAGSYGISLTAVGEGSEGSAVVTREWQTPGVTMRTLTIAQDQVVGRLFLPAGNSSAHPRPAVLVIGGSDGGAPVGVAQVLASEGYPALALVYFDVPGLPSTLTNIPLEYFEHAAADLSNVPGVDRSRILIDGGSRGSEAALLVADNFPSAIHGAIVTSPSSVTVASFPAGTTTAWTLHGVPIPTGTVIPVDQIAGPVLVFAGAADQLWPSSASAENLQAALDNAHNPFPDKVTVYPGAGHGSDGMSTLPAMTTQTQSITGQTLDLGGTRAADAAAQADTWKQILALLKSLSS